MRRVLVCLFVVIGIGFTLAGCAAPGASRLERTPKAMPPSLQHLTADVLGFTLYDTNPNSLRWQRSGIDGSAVLAALYGEVGIDAAEAAPWIGAHAGVAIRQLPAPSEDVPDARIWFADVRDRAALDEALPKLRAHGRAVQAYDDGVLVASSKAGLDAFIDAADAYAVPQRKAMREYAAEAATKAPAAAVFRFDLIRTQVRRPFQDDPALLEFARWATESDDLLATRDGWVGLTGGGTGKPMKLIGNAEWVPDLSADVDWGHARAAQLDAVTIDANAVVAVDGIGQHLSAIVTGITRRNGQYATEQDVPKSERPVDLEPILDELDGPATVAWNEHDLQLVVQGAGKAADDVTTALTLAGVPGTAVRTKEGDLDVFVALSPIPNEMIRDVDRPSRAGDARAAGAPPSPPIAWLWKRSIAGCTSPAAGWVTFDGEGEMTFSIGTRIQHARACDPAMLVPSL